MEKLRQKRHKGGYSMINAILGFFLFLVFSYALVLGASGFFVVGIPLLQSLKKDSLYSTLTQPTFFDKIMIVIAACMTAIISLACIGILIIIPIAIMF